MIIVRNSLVKSLCNIFVCINKLLQVVCLGWGRGCFPVGVLPCENINVLIFDLIM
jgi:hypothetical protein